MTALDLEGLDWTALRRLRSGFLDGVLGEAPYWTADSDLESYDRTFGERIGWKWDHVVDELELRGWSPPEGPVLDWGCGSGVAGRRFTARFDREIDFWDRSPRAVSFARGKGVEAGLAVKSIDGDPGTLLVSHVLGELANSDLDRVIALALRSTAVVFVEPGDYKSSRALIAVRERLLGEMNVVAPCTHQSTCGLLVEGRERDWCHHFARAPWQVFADPGWARFSNELGIDLHSTPLSFVVMDRRPVEALATGAMHLVGSPRVQKPHVLVFGCDVTGVGERRLTKRRHPDLYRQVKKGHLEAVAFWETDGDEIVSWTPLEHASDRQDSE